MEKIYKYNENFPNIDKWLDEYHEECSEYIKSTSKTVNELAHKVSGPVAKATRILHARKSNMYFENNLFRQLKEGQYTGQDDDFKERIQNFNSFEYHEQIQLVKEILAAKNARLEEVVRSEDELTED